MRVCLRCKQEGEFGRDAARPDKLNVYCKSCCRETVYARRQEARRERGQRKRLDDLVVVVVEEAEEQEVESALRPELVSCFQRVGDRRVHGWSSPVGAHSS